MNLRLIWNEKLAWLFAAKSRPPRRRRVLGALESLEARVNLSAILVVETANAYWVIEDDSYGAAANHANTSGDDGDGGSNNLEVLPYATTDLLVSPNGELAHAEKSSQLEDADDNDATPNDSSRSLAQAGGSSLITGNASVSHTDTPTEKTTTDVTVTNTLLNRLFADTGITNADVVSVRLLPNVSLEDLVESENDSGDNTTDRSGSDNASAESSSSRTPRSTLLTATSGASATPASATSPNDQPTSKPPETAAASSAGNLVTWLRTYFQKNKPKSAADSDQPELGNADSTDPSEHARIVILNAAFPQVAAMTAVVANVDQLFAKFQLERADDTGSVSALRYLRNVVDAGEMEDGSDTGSDAGASFSLSYSQWASLASVVALASGALSKKPPCESRDEDRLPPFRARTETKLRVACVVE